MSFIPFVRFRRRNSLISQLIIAIYVLNCVRGMFFGTAKTPTTSLHHIHEIGSTSEEEDDFGFHVVGKEKEDDYKGFAILSDSTESLSGQPSSKQTKSIPIRKVVEQPPRSHPINTPACTRRENHSERFMVQSSDSLRSSGAGHGRKDCDGSRSLSSSIIDNYEPTERFSSLPKDSSGSSRSGSGFMATASRSRILDSPNSPTFFTGPPSIKRPPIVGNAKVGDLLMSPNFVVDKSYWVSLWIHHGPRFSAHLRPKKFGKTTTLNFAQLFLDHTSKMSRPASDLTMFKRSAQQVADHHAKYCVITVELGHPSIMNTSTFEAFKRAIIQYLASSIRALLRKYRRTSYDVPEELRERFELLGSQYPSNHLVDWQDCLALLIDLGHAFSGLPVILFVDDYDSVIFKAYHLYCFDHIKPFFSILYSKALAEAEVGKLFRACFFGVQQFHGRYPFKDIPDFRWFSLGDDPYGAEFGFNHRDLLELLNTFSTGFLGSDISKNFGGYPCGNQVNSAQACMINPLAVAKTFRYGRLEAGHALSHMNLQIESLPFRYAQGFGIGDMFLLFSGSKNFQSNHVVSHVDLSSDAHKPSLSTFVTYLILEGYLTIQEGSVVPVNSNMKEYLLGYVRTSFDEKLGITEALISLGEREFAEFRRKLTKAWNHQPFTHHDPASSSLYPEAFISLFLQVAQEKGCHICRMTEILKKDMLARMYADRSQPEPGNDNDDDDDDELMEVGKCQGANLFRFAAFQTVQTDKGGVEEVEYRFLMTVAFYPRSSMNPPAAHHLLHLSLLEYHRLQSEEFQRGKGKKSSGSSSQGGSHHHIDYPPVSFAVGIVFCHRNPDPLIVYQAVTENIQFK